MSANFCVSLRVASRIAAKGSRTEVVLAEADAPSCPEVKLQFTPSGRIQFLTALSYIDQDNPQAAVEFRTKAERILRRLTHCRSRVDLLQGVSRYLREVIIAPYRFFYRREGNTIWVVACWGDVADGTSGVNGRLTIRCTDGPLRGPPLSSSFRLLINTFVDDAV